MEHHRLTRDRACLVRQVERAFVTKRRALGFGGTSAACPYAAGAVAALQAAAQATQGRFLTPAEVRTILAATGDLVRDQKNTSITKPRINLGRAIESLGQNRSFTTDKYLTFIPI